MKLKKLFIYFIIFALLPLMKTPALASENLAKNATAYLQSNSGAALSPSSNQVAEYAIDGDITTGACAAGDWIWTLHLDLGIVQERINQVALTFLNDTMKPTDFEILLSEDGVKWVTVKSIQNNTVFSRKIYEFDPMDARYVRVRDLKAYEGISQMIIAEIEVYANDTETASVYLLNVDESGEMEGDVAPILKFSQPLPPSYFSKIKLMLGEKEVLCEIYADDSGKEITVDPKEVLIVGETYTLRVENMNEWKLKIIDRSPMEQVTVRMLNMNELDFSDYVPDHLKAENAIDGNEDTIAQLELGVSGDFTFIYEMDFHRLYDHISRVNVTFGTSIPPFFEIAVSTDGKKWATVASAYTYGNKDHTMNFPPVTARYLRVLPKERHVNIAEVEVLCIPKEQQELPQESPVGELTIETVSESEYMNDREHAIYPAFVDNMPYQSWTEEGSCEYYQIMVSGGKLPYRFQLTNGRLPEGLILSSDGKIFGMATLEETQTFTIQVTDGGGNTVSKTLSMTAHPYRAYWFEEARFGAMIQWGAYAKPQTMDIPTFEERIKDGWDADKWAQQIYDMGGRVLNMTLLAGDGVRLWPSDVPAITNLTTKRDMAGELIEAFHKRGMKVISYIAGDYTWVAGNNIADPQTGSASDFTLECVRELLEKGLDGVWFDTGSIIGQTNFDKVIPMIRTVNPFATIENNPGADMEGWIPGYPNVDMYTIECSDQDPTTDALPIAVRPSVRKKMIGDTNALLGPKWAQLDDDVNDASVTQLKPVEAIIENIQQNWDNDATYMLVWPVASNGDLMGHEKVAQYVKEIGEWVNANREPTQKPKASLDDHTEYSGPQLVSLTSEEGAKIYYTLDGSTPDDTSIPYNGPITITESTRLNACAYIEGKGKSRIMRMEYVILKEDEEVSSLLSQEDINQLVKMPLDKTTFLCQASSSRIVNGNDTLGAMCDGDETTAWYPDWGDTEVGAWAAVELDALYLLSEIVVRGTPGMGEISAFVSEDGQSWTYVAGGAINEEKTLTLSLPEGTKGKFIKFEKSAQGEPGYEFMISEINLYGGCLEKIEKPQMIGMIVQTGRHRVLIDSVGRFCTGEDGSVHRISITPMQAGKQPLLSADIDMSQGETDELGFRYKKVAPVILEPYTAYRILCEEDKNGYYLESEIEFIRNDDLKIYDGVMSDFTETKYYAYSYIGDKRQTLNIKYKLLEESELDPRNIALGARTLLLDNQDRVRVESVGRGPASNAVDGSRETAAGPNAVWAWTLFVDLEQVYTQIDEIKVLCSEGLYPTEYEIYASTDNETWTQITHVTDNHDTDLEHVYEPFAARYFKIRSLKPDGPGQEGSQMWIDEVEIYETEGAISKQNWSASAYAVHPDYSQYTPDYGINGKAGDY